MYCISLLQLSINECVPAYNCGCVSRKGLGQRIDFGQRVVGASITDIDDYDLNVGSVGDLSSFRLIT